MSKFDLEELRRRRERLDQEIAQLEFEERYRTEIAKQERFVDTDFWLVQTEGDDEARTYKTLGVFYGPLLWIALRLVPNKAWSLTFTRETSPVGCKKCNFVTVQEWEHLPLFNKTNIIIVSKELSLYCQDEQLRALATLGLDNFLFTKGGPYGSIDVTLLED